MTMAPDVHTGSCLCGAVRFEVAGSLPGPDACHCTQCRKFSGHYFVSTDVPRSAVTIHGVDNLTWFWTDEVRRGFCSRCGASLLWDAGTMDTIGIAMGAFDPPTGTRLAVHVFVANKGDYYDITDGVPQHQQCPTRPPPP
jgi:hypothetical protein